MSGKAGVEDMRHQKDPRMSGISSTPPSKYRGVPGSELFEYPDMLGKRLSKIPAYVRYGRARDIRNTQESQVRWVNWSYHVNTRGNLIFFLW